MSSTLKNLVDGLKEKYNSICNPESTSLANIFDFEKVFLSLTLFTNNGSLVIPNQDRVIWETSGLKEFEKFWSCVCDLPQVRKALEQDPELNLMPHDSPIILRRFKQVLVDMVWRNKYQIAHTIFVDEQKKEIQANSFSLNKFREAKPSRFSLHEFFELSLESGEKILARINEEKIISSFYTNEDVYGDVGREFSIALDVALGASGCEAIVEGFYSVMNLHKKSGNQTNRVLVERSIVDWTLPNPVCCPNTVRSITTLYTDGDPKYKLKKHRSVLFFDKQNRSRGTYNTSKVVDRLKSEQPKFPFITDDDI